MSKELIEQLRRLGDPLISTDYEMLEQAARRIEELERFIKEQDALLQELRPIIVAASEVRKECDALQADNARLREALVKHVAPYLGHKEVYDEVLASIPAQSLARLRNRVLDEAINVAWNNEPDCNGPIEMALRKLNEPE